MKNLRLKIFVSILFVFQLLLMINTLLILKDTIFDINNAEIVSKQDKLFLFAAFLFWAIVSIVFVILIFQLSAQKEKIIIEVPVKNKIDKNAEKKKRNVEEQRRLSEIEKKRNKTINSIMNGLNANLELKDYSEKLLSNLSKQYELVQGIVFTRTDKDVFQKRGTYAFYREEEALDFKEGVGIAGQVAANKELINISNLPEKYLTVLSGLGNSSPANLLIFPILSDNKAIGIVEVATFVKMDKLAEQVLMVLSRRVGEHIHKILKPAK